ncbi:TPA: TlpA family protein disulfide reductase [Candidatus Bipolaricaulota bacterium]|nr:TlpA family protein disulfide reductase [Candidatus Bipolaricaulota bacterium]
MAGQLLVAILVMILAMSVLLSPPEGGLPGAGRFAIVGKPAPPFTLRGSSGEWRLSDHLGKPMIIAFWTTWCGACLQDLQVLEEFHRRYGGQVEVVGVCPERWHEVPPILARYRITFPVLYDRGAQVTARYQLLENLRYPFTVFVNGEGRVTGVWAVIIRDLTQLLELLGRAGISVTGG